MEGRAFRYEATGSVAHERISPLLPKDWIDSQVETGNGVPDFLWENAQRKRTKAYRDSVSVYSHLPNGSNMLDSKWVLGRLFSEPRGDDDSNLLATLETHCFRGSDGFHDFCRQVNLFDDHQSTEEKKIMTLPDIVKDAPRTDAVEPVNLWVIKDAQANGAGGIWVVGPRNVKEFVSDKSKLFPEHLYVAQKYAWPPVLFGGRKSHVRVYGLLTADGRAFVHHRAFLHVANDPFTSSTSSSQFEESVHITNCCANSHDDYKFAGEILADFEELTETERDGERVIPLSDYFPSIQACVSSLAKRIFPFLQGGNANHGFEYLGLDFILSHDDNEQPVAYMLEINAPPSQDTATGLKHAENLHDQVMRDLISLWVFPHIPGMNATEILGGWRCVHEEAHEQASEGRELIVPSKAAIISKIRWAIFERKARKKEKQEEEAQAKKEPEEVEGTAGDCNDQIISKFARSQFPYLVCSDMHNTQVFFENAGGSQVAQPVIDAMAASLSFRHRTMVGAKTKQAAREAFQEILGARRHDPLVLGPNASSLLFSLAALYVELGLLAEKDEIVISTENHLANVQPWERAAKAVGARIRWWTPFCKEKDVVDSSCSARLEDLLSSKTRIVAIPHASNILGQIRDVRTLSSLIKLRSDGRAHVVVDGVAAAPHWFPNVQSLQADWYVVSGHKIFGPHLGGLYGRRGGAVELISAAAGSSSGNCDECVFQLLERGTANYEGCAGIVGLGKYFSLLAACTNERKSEAGFRHERTLQSGEVCSESEDFQFENGRGMDVTKNSLTADQACGAYSFIRIAEGYLVQALFDGLQRFPKVRIIEGDEHDLTSMARLPIVSLVHEDIKAETIRRACEKAGFSCRVSSFLCTEHLAKEFAFERSEGILRLSLAHYNTVQEVHSFLQVLSSIPGFD